MAVYRGVLYDDCLPKTTTFEWSQEWSSYTGLTVIRLITIKNDKEKKFLQINTFFISIYVSELTILAHWENAHYNIAIIKQALVRLVP